MAETLLQIQRGRHGEPIIKVHKEWKKFDNEKRQKIVLFCMEILGISRADVVYLIDQRGNQRQ